MASSKAKASEQEQAGTVEQPDGGKAADEQAAPAGDGDNGEQADGGTAAQGGTAPVQGEDGIWRDPATGESVSPQRWPGQQDRPEDQPPLS
jgi:hypothetical protein